MYTILKINLSAFEGGGDGAAAPAAAQGSNPAPAQPGTGSNAANAQPQSGNAPDAQAQGQQPPEPTFDELVKGKYRADYEARVQEFVTRRLRNANAELDGMRPIMAILQQRYGVEDGKGAAAAVLEGLRNDETYWQAAADKAGMTAEQMRQMAMAEAHSRELQARLDAFQTEAAKQEAFRQLAAQVEQVKAQYPDFDVNAELAANPRFGAMVRNGIDMLTAYQVCHQQEFLAAAQRQAEDKIAGTVRANQARPAENGTGGSQPVKLNSDPSKWTMEQFRDVYKRVGRGERIVL
jgi:hypothetical protein